MLRLHSAFPAAVDILHTADAAFCLSLCIVLQLFCETLLFGRLGFLQPEFGIYRDTAALFRSMTHHIIAAVAGVPLPTRRYANWFAPVAWVVKSSVPVGEPCSSAANHAYALRHLGCCLSAAGFNICFDFCLAGCRRHVHRSHVDRQRAG